MAQYVECPENFRVNDFDHKIFLAGGISSCPKGNDVVVHDNLQDLLDEVIGAIE